MLPESVLYCFGFIFVLVRIIFYTNISIYISTLLLRFAKHASFRGVFTISMGCVIYT